MKQSTLNSMHSIFNSAKLYTAKLVLVSDGIFASNEPNCSSNGELSFVKPRCFQIQMN